MEPNPILLVVFFLTFDCCLTQEPQEKICVNGYELSFFYNVALQRNNDKAREACKNYERSRLVKVDSSEITTVIDSVLKINYNTFYIDGKADTKRNWTWSDGSKIYLSGERGGYQNWYDGQPNNVGKNENCIIVGRRTKQWKDSACREKLGYICQKDLDPCITVDSSIPNVHKCIASGSKVPHVEWRKDNVTITANSKQTVYQIKALKIATLYFENATIGDTGAYICTTWIGVNGTEKSSKPVKILVNGKPSVTKIKSFPCNSSLLVSWKPNHGAIGFLHRIKANAKADVVNISVTPLNEKEIHTEITGLRPSTKYAVQISACVKNDYCTVERSIFKNTTTRRSVKTVTNVSLEQLNENTCIVTWNWPHIKGNATKFMVRLHSDLIKSDEIRIVNGKYSYSFEPQHGLSYSVKVQSPESLRSCGEVLAVGVCTGKDRQQNNPIVTIVIVVLIVALILACSVAAFLFWKNKQAAHNEMDVTLTIRPENPAPAAQRDVNGANGLYEEVDKYLTVDEIQTYPVNQNTVGVVYQNYNQPANSSTDPTYENFANDC